MAEFHRLKSLQDKEPEEWTQWNGTAENLAKTAEAADMPSLDHLTRADYLHVYEPAEDTYLLIDALRYEFERGIFDEKPIADTTKGETSGDDGHVDDFVLLEIGCGTGVPTVWFRREWARRYPNRPLRTYVTDINPKALQVAMTTDEKNNGMETTALSPIQALRCDLAMDLLESLGGSVHVLIFNPPYVPTPDEEVVEFHSADTGATAESAEPIDDSIIAAAWAGGTDGRRVVDRALPHIQRLLKGTAYLVTVDDNRPSALAELCASEHQLDMKPLFRRRAHNEYLTIQKMVPFSS